MEAEVAGGRNDVPGDAGCGEAGRQGDGRLVDLEESEVWGNGHLGDGLLHTEGGKGVVGDADLGQSARQQPGPRLCEVVRKAVKKLREAVDLPGLEGGYDLGPEGAGLDPQHGSASRNFLRNRLRGCVRRIVRAVRGYLRLRVSGRVWEGWFYHPRLLLVGGCARIGHCRSLQRLA